MAFASTSSTTESVLADSPEWLRLLHYRKSLSGSAGHSQVDDDDFFLSENGNRDPIAELQATVQALQSPVTSGNNQTRNLNQHPVCRFPARWAFLKRHLPDIQTLITPDHCPEYQRWRESLNPHSVSLVLASSYLNSPSSMFGHTFLRIDPPAVEQGSTWLSYAINFGAELNPEDNSILYAYKGIFGGYAGFFSIIPYYEKIKEYSQIENRDLWEYNLKLSPTATKAMVTHLWELRDIEFEYYFFDENCSYRLLELIEVALPDVDLTSEYALRAIPVDTIRTVVEANLVNSVTYRPSKASEIEFEISQLSGPQQSLAWELAHQQTNFESPRFLELPMAQKRQVVQLGYDHLRYLQQHKIRDTETAQRSLQLLSELSRLPGMDLPVPTPDIRPEESHRTYLLGLAGGESRDNDFADLRLRLSYHDLLDNREGFLDGAAINIGELHLRKFSGEAFQIEDLSLVDIQSHSPRSRFFDPLTWRVQMGWNRQYAEADDYLTTQMNGGAGVTYPLGEAGLAYALGKGRLEYNELLDDKVVMGAGPLFGALFYWPFGTLQLESQYLAFTDGSERYQHQLIQNLPLGGNSLGRNNIGRNNALRLSIQHSREIETVFNEFSLEFRHYF